MGFTWDPRKGFVKNTEERQNREIGYRVYGQPLDSGYAWVVLMAAMILEFIIVTTRNSIPTLYNEEVKRLNTSSWIDQLNNKTSSGVKNGIGNNNAFKYFSYSFIASGFVVPYLIRLYGCRTIGFIGSVGATVGFLITAQFNTNRIVVIIVFDVFTCICRDMVLFFTLIVVTIYFLKRRSFALGMVMAMVPWSEFLRLYYIEPEVQYLGNFLWISSGLYFFAAFLTLLYIPLKKDDYIAEEKEEEINYLKYWTEFLGLFKDVWIVVFTVALTAGSLGVSSFSIIHDERVTDRSTFLLYTIFLTIGSVGVGWLADYQKNKFSLFTLITFSSGAAMLLLLLSRTKTAHVLLQLVGLILGGLRVMGLVTTIDMCGFKRLEQGWGLIVGAYAFSTIIANHLKNKNDIKWLLVPSLSLIFNSLLLFILFMHKRSSIQASKDQSMKLEKDKAEDKDATEQN